MNDFPREPIGCPIEPGRDYRYLAGWPKGRSGHLYRVERFVQDVPSYQEKVLVECLSGPDAGLWFVVSLANFAQRYELVREEEAIPAPPLTVVAERIIDMTSRGKF